MEMCENNIGFRIFEYIRAIIMVIKENYNNLFSYFLSKRQYYDVKNLYF